MPCDGPAPEVIDLRAEVGGRAFDKPEMPRIAPAEQVRIPRRAPEAHAINRHAFGHQVMKIRVLLCLVLPGIVRVFARLPRVVLVVAGHVNDG